MSVTQLVYKYCYGDEYVLGTSIYIYKHTDSSNLYDLEITFDVFDKEMEPKIKSYYEIISHQINETIKDDIILSIQHKIQITAVCNPPPETLISILR